MNDELKACPFCSGTPLVKGEYAYCTNEGCSLYWVPIGVGNWNRRPVEIRLRAERDDARRHCLREVELLASENEINQKLRDRLAAAYDVIGDFLAIYTVDSPVTVGYISEAVEKAKAVIAPAEEE